MKLCDVLQGIPVIKCSADLDMEITGVSYDSRKTQAGDLFVAMVGVEVDGHGFLCDAVKNGAVCILCQQIAEGMDVPYVQVEQSREALALVSANWFQHPSRQMTMIGVTGTNGKTTTTYLFKELLERICHTKVGLIGTNQNMIGTDIFPTERTTPESYELHELLYHMYHEGCTHVVMEVSSHALALSRVYGISFAVGIFTNLTQDHLDFHKTMDDYCHAKAKLFQMCRVGIVNGDDPWRDALLRDATCDTIIYGRGGGVQLQADDVRLSNDSIAFDALYQGERIPVYLRIPGEFMVYNTLDVLGGALALGISLKESADVLKDGHSVRGRVERVPVCGDYTMLIDYAHTPDAMANVLRSVRGFTKGRVIALFGCGGDRDRGKRPQMGEIAAKLSDLVIVTSDNPRTEDPKGIIQDILSGMYQWQTPHIVIEDRVDAIHYAMDHAQAGDVVVLMGKGHETYQIIGTQKRHLDEREIIAAYDCEL